MNRRQRKAMRSVKLSWITKEPRRALVFYLINTPLPKSGFLACISSRITTVIQVVRYYQINDNWFNEPFAVSRYKLLILRHAWLNLWDKHMTTGRINQVTILCPAGAAKQPARTKPPRNAWESGRCCYKEGNARALRRKHPAPGTGRARLANSRPWTIQLPPLSFPKSGPPWRLQRSW